MYCLLITTFKYVVFAVISIGYEVCCCLFSLKQMGYFFIFFIKHTLDVMKTSIFACLIFDEVALITMGQIFSNLFFGVP